MSFCTLFDLSAAAVPLVVVIHSKVDESRQLFYGLELRGLAIRVEVQKNSRLIGQCHRYQVWACAVVLHRTTQVFQMCF
nr:unnamed protein product [Callosobruchus chinensis]CAH7754398.1 unnamed protein product [Callosobruchus chinensis]